MKRPASASLWQVCVQTEAHYFSCAQTQPGKQHQDRVIALADGRLPITAGQDLFYVYCWKGLWQCRKRPTRHCRHTGRQIQRDISTIPCKSQKRPQCCCHHLRSLTSQLCRLPLNESGDVRCTNRSEFKRATAKSCV